MAAVFCYFYTQFILDLLVWPLAKIWHQPSGRSFRLIYTDLVEPFLLHLRIAIYSGGILAFPILAWQVWRFIAPGLYKKEQQFTRFCLWMSPLLFLLGAGLVYLLVMPMAWPFLLSFETATSTNPFSLPMQIEPRVDAYISLVLKMMSAFGICFQLPLIIILLAKFGWLRKEDLIRYRRYVIVGIFVVAAVLTPPDILSQLMLAIPLMILYEISIWCSTYWSRPH